MILIYNSKANVIVYHMHLLCKYFKYLLQRFKTRKFDSYLAINICMHNLPVSKIFLNDNF